MLEKGILKYAKRGTDVGITSRAPCVNLAYRPMLQTHANKVFCLQLKKGKLHGCIDVGLSVMSIKKKAMCIDLDTEDNIYHLKVTLKAHIIFEFSVIQSLYTLTPTHFYLSFIFFCTCKDS